jgi:ABC-2 type transport system ATP-binding protein
MMLGLTEPTSGSVKVCDIDPSFDPIGVKRRVGYLPEDVGFYPNRSGMENLMFTARLNSLPGKEAKHKVEQILDRVGLSEATEKSTGKYSRGMLQRLGLADVLIKNPEVIILDEPTLGLDPGGIREFLELIVRLSREEGITVLFSSHDLHQVQQVCDRVGLFVKGKLLAEGDIQTLSKKLFSGAQYIIEAAIPMNIHGNPDHSHDSYSAGWLSGLLQHIEGVLSVKRENDLFQIECSRDLTTDIAKILVESGGGLSYLNKKEYGLNDIYYRYFEGGEGHE